MPSSSEHRYACRQFRQAGQISRRDALRIGGLMGLGLTLPELLAQRASGAEDRPLVHRSFGNAKQVIVLYLHGGHPQQETFDPKPQGPSAVRGEFGAIATRVPGIDFCELLPLTALVADKLAVVRSMSHSNPNHVTASLAANTGHAHPPGTPEQDFPPAETDFPPFGAVLDALRQAPAANVHANSGAVPHWVRVGPLMRRNNGTVLHGQLPGFLGAKHSSFVVDQQLLAPSVKIEAIEPSEGLSSMRFSARRDLLAQFDQQRRLMDQSAQAKNLSGYYQRAFSLLASDRTRVAFDLAAELPKVRDRYGSSEFGQRCLLARRLAEAGVPMINVSYCHTPAGSWDTHSQNFRQMKDSLAPTFDSAFSALVEDLDQRGMLDDTLVFVNAEFGRTPAINKNAGRDHWPWVYSLVLAGAGVKPGIVYGASDNAAAYPAQRPHDPKDMAATLYHLLGVAPQTTIHDSLNRPHPLIIGRPIDGILA